MSLDRARRLYRGAMTRRIRRHASCSAAARSGGCPRNSPDTRYNQASFRRSSDLLKHAEALLREALEFDPRHVDALNNLGL